MGGLQREIRDLKLEVNGLRDQSVLLQHPIYIYPALGGPQNPHGDPWTPYPAYPSHITFHTPETHANTTLSTTPGPETGGPFRQQPLRAERGPEGRIDCPFPDQSRPTPYAQAGGPDEGRRAQAPAPQVADDAAPGPPPAEV